MQSGIDLLPNPLHLDQGSDLLNVEQLFKGKYPKITCFSRKRNLGSFEDQKPYKAGSRLIHHVMSRLLPFLISVEIHF